MDLDDLIDDVENIMPKKTTTIASKQSALRGIGAANNNDSLDEIEDHFEWAGSSKPKTTTTNTGFGLNR